MTTGPLGEAGATSSSPHGPPVPSDRSGDSLTGESQTHDSFPADTSTPNSTTAPAEQQDVGHEVQSPSGDKDKDGPARGSNQEEPEEVTTLLSQDPGWAWPAEDTRVTQRPAASPSDAQGQEQMPQEASVAQGQLEPVPSAPHAETLSSGAANRSAAGPRGQFDPPVPAVPGAAQDRARAPKATSPAHDVGSVPPSPGPHQGTLGTWPLDPSQYAANEENDYMQSMTSLLGGGEGTIGPLADILVWPEATVGMGMALGLLATGHSSPTDLLSSTGPALRSVSSILGSIIPTFSAGLAVGTGSLGPVLCGPCTGDCAAEDLGGHLLCKALPRQSPQPTQGPGQPQQRPLRTVTCSSPAPAKQ